VHSIESAAPAARNEHGRSSIEDALWRRALANPLARGYVIALFFVASALLVTLFLQRFFQYPFLFLFFAAVMATAWFGGTGAGFFAVLLSTIAVDYFFVPPFHSFAVNATDGAYFLAFVVCAVAASWVSSSKKKDQAQLQEARDRLEVRVAERTAALERSNAELRQREQQLILLTEVIPQQIWRGAADGSIDYCNQRLLDYVGRTMKEVRGERFMEIIHPEDRGSLRQSWERALSSSLPFEGEFRVCGAGGQYRSFFTRGVPLQEATGNILSWYGTNTDIEELKSAERALMRTQAELAYLSRVLTMGELTASIAHEVNQPLTAVVAFGNACLEWLSADPPNLEEARLAAGRIIKDGARAGAIIARIRALFQKERAAKSQLDMNDVIQELIVFLRHEATRHRISIQTDLDPGLSQIKGDRVQLQQVVLNLIMNAIDALLEAATCQKEVLVRSRNENPTGIRIVVEDSGAGFSPEIAEKIFNPFFTTKSEGIGMGLSISRSIVESHQGRLWAVPRPSGGSIFQFTIPEET